MTLEFYNLFIGTLGLIAIGLILIILISNLLKDSELSKGFLKFIQKHSLKLIALFTLAPIIGSLTYSDYFGLTPCKLCWYQRIFMYPMFFLALVGLKIKDKNTTKYTITLATLGSLVSIYQLYLQFFAEGYDNCSIVGQNASCSKIWIKVFDFMTIPSMALICFILVILISLNDIRSKK